jgi:hypothetical protein
MEERLGPCHPQPLNHDEPHQKERTYLQEGARGRSWIYVEILFGVVSTRPPTGSGDVRTPNAAAAI